MRHGRAMLLSGKSALSDHDPLAAHNPLVRLEQLNGLNRFFSTFAKL